MTAEAFADPACRPSDADLASRPIVYRPDLLEGQVALVSGAGSGIGRALTFLLVRLGARVMLCGRTEAKLAEVAEAVREHTGGEVAYRAMTIRDPAQAADVVDAAYRTFGRLDILVNNAGGQYSQNAIELTSGGWNAVVDTNLNGTWHMMQSAARNWVERGCKGSVVNVVRTVERGVPQAAHSCAARAGVIGLTRTVAVEWAPHGIRVNCVAPGPIATDGLASHPAERIRSLHMSNPMKRIGDVWDVAEGIAYLCARSGDFITGTTLTIDGGMTLWGEMWMAGKPSYFQDSTP